MSSSAAARSTPDQRSAHSSPRAGAGRRSQPEQDRDVRVRQVGGREQPRDVLGGGRAEVGRARPGRGGLASAAGLAGIQAPAGRLGQRAAHDRVDLAHRGRRRRRGADPAADAQHRIESGPGWRGPAAGAGSARAPGGSPGRCGLIGDAGAPGQVGDLEPARQQLRDGGVAGGPLTVVDSIEEAGAERLRVAFGPGGSGEVAPLVGDRVVAGVDDDLPGLAALAAVARCHGPEGAR